MTVHDGLRIRVAPGERIITGEVGPIARPEPWTVSALCAQSDPEEWFPETGGKGREAARICNGGDDPFTDTETTCPVRSECRAYALRHRERTGIWGGLSTPQRISLESRDTSHTCYICRTKFEGKPGQKYCSHECHMESRRINARRERTA